MVSWSIPPDSPPEYPGGSAEVDGALLWVGVHPFPEESLILHLLPDQTARYSDLLCAYDHLESYQIRQLPVPKLPFGASQTKPLRLSLLFALPIDRKSFVRAYHMLAIQQLFCNNGRQTPKHMGPGIYHHRLQTHIQAVSTIIASLTSNNI